MVDSGPGVHETSTLTLDPSFRFGARVQGRTGDWFRSQSTESRSRPSEPQFS